MEQICESEVVFLCFKVRVSHFPGLPQCPEQDWQLCKGENIAPLASLCGESWGWKNGPITTRCIIEEEEGTGNSMPWQLESPFSASARASSLSFRPLLQTEPGRRNTRMPQERVSSRGARPSPICFPSPEVGSHLPLEYALF